jgi:hypothetical protein
MNRIFAAFESRQNSNDLTRLCLDLLSQQKKTWSDLHQGYEALDKVREREIACRGFSVHLQYNPGRINSSLADVDKKTVSVRPCFLCRNNLPEKQRGIVFEKEFLILCNPAPVFPSHLTICHREHRPQSMAENAVTFLQLIADLGDAWILLYNGPKCGASAPDHLHFQAVERGSMPIETQIIEENRLDTIREARGVQLSRARGLGREILVLDGDDRDALAVGLIDVLFTLKAILLSDEEAMVNVVGFHSMGKTRVLVFPRKKHRPEVFFRAGDDRIVVSPGAVEMGGVFVTPVERDFERLDAPTVEGILEEVCLDEKIMDRVIEALLRKNP